MKFFQNWSKDQFASNFFILTILLTLTFGLESSKNSCLSMVISVCVTPLLCDLRISCVPGRSLAYLAMDVDLFLGCSVVGCCRHAMKA